MTEELGGSELPQLGVPHRFLGVALRASVPLPPLCAPPTPITSDCLLVPPAEPAEAPTTPTPQKLPRHSATLDWPTYGRVAQLGQESHTKRYYRTTDAIELPSEHHGQVRPGGSQLTDAQSEKEAVSETETPQHATDSTRLQRQALPITAFPTQPTQTGEERVQRQSCIHRTHGTSAPTHLCLTCFPHLFNPFAKERSLAPNSFRHLPHFAPRSTLLVMMTV